MIRIPPWGLILIGFAFVVIGVVVPFLMVIRLIPSTFFLNFLSYGVSLTGLFLGIIGASQYMRRDR
ncbi:MAG TPA: hypothetical protein VK900_08210 [Anaerolineales bacterium]|nr:hypothetical protein [Anaerolineales bacterium]